MKFRFERKGYRWYEHSDDPGFWGNIEGNPDSEFPEPTCLLFYLQWRITHSKTKEGWYDALLKFLKENANANKD